MNVITIYLMDFPYKKHTIFSREPFHQPGFDEKNNNNNKRGVASIRG